VSEETQNSEEKAKLDPELLKAQADELRQTGYLRGEDSPKAPARWVQGIYLGVLVLVIASVLFLLVFRESRVRLLRSVGRAWTTLSSTEQQAEVFKLPPPPPKSVEPKVVLQGSPTFVFRSGSPTAQPAGQPDAAEPGNEGGQQDETKPPAPPEKTAGSSGAYQLLVKNSEVARKLTTNALPDLQFKEWKPVRNNPPEFWINVVASRGGQNVEFVWSVNTESGTIRALSQNARDLERK